jgi:DNA-binding response OmpR family regulator
MERKAVGRQRALLPQTQTIPIIDDDANIRSIVRRLFVTQGYHVYETLDGVTAHALAPQSTLDLIILDLGCQAKAAPEST